MELYTKTVSKATFVFPTTTTVVNSASYSINGGAYIALTVTSEAASAFVMLPYLQEECELSIKWNITIPDSGTFDEVVVYSVVTPYLTLTEVKAIYSQASDEEARNIEAAVRHIINAHTGQSFGLSTKSITVEGHGESALRLPERLLTITSLATLTAELNIHRTAIISDGWYLKKGWADVVSTIQTDDEYFTGTDVLSNAAPGEPGYEKSDHGPIIVVPGFGGKSTPWQDDYPFKITGKWGYYNVPQPVKEAAKLLVNDYACSEQLYRDRYLESVKAADWRLQFSSRAWDFTGNVRADQLLSQYVLLDWAVV